MSKKLLSLSVAVLLITFAVMFGMAPKAYALYGLEKHWFSVTDELGNPIVSDYASIDILVYDAGTNDKATIYSDDTGTSKSQSSAWNLSSSGVAEFYTSAASVDITVTNSYATVKAAGFTKSDHQIQLRNEAPLTNIDTTIIGAVTPAAGSFTTGTIATAVITELGYTSLTDETVTMSSGDPQGTGVLSTTTLISYVITDAAGASADLVTLADGTAGQIKIVILKTDNETTGLQVKPATYVNASGSNDVLLEDAGDTVSFVFDGTSWSMLYTRGGTEE